MPNTDAILRVLEARALKAKKNTEQQQTQGMQNVSPLIQSYNSWSTGNTPSSALPRPYDQFMSGGFGPLRPNQPTPLDAPGPGSKRPEPRRWQYPVGWNLNVAGPGMEGLKLVSFSNLRAYRDMYSIVSACISVRKQEILGIEWDIKPTDHAEKQMRDDKDAHRDFQERRQQALRFFRQPDPNYHNFQSWLGAIIEEILVTDAVTIYLHPSRMLKKGLFGSDLAAMDILDGTTIRPLLDIRGGIPRPPSPAYQQYLFGVPRSETMDVVTNGDIAQMREEFGDKLPEPIEQYRADQLMYLPYNKRAWTPYGFSATEQAIVPILTGLRRQEWALSWFTEGTIPGMFISPGADISTPVQIQQLQNALNAVAGDKAYSHKIIVLPSGSVPHPIKNPELADRFDEMIYSNVMMAFDVMPMELGVSPKTSSSQSSGAASQMAKTSSDINNRKALKPLLLWLKSSIFDYVLQNICGQEDMEWWWAGLEPVNDREMLAKLHADMVEHGLESIDEARVDLGYNPWGLPVTSEPIYNTPQGPIPLKNIEALPLVAQTSGAGGTPATADAVLDAQAQSGKKPTESTPLHEGHAGVDDKEKATKKQADDEIEALRRFLRNGKDFRGFIPKFNSFETIDKLGKEYERNGIEGFYGLRARLRG